MTAHQNPNWLPITLCINRSRPAKDELNPIFKGFFFITYISKPILYRLSTIWELLGKICYEKKNK